MFFKSEKMHIMIDIIGFIVAVTLLLTTTFLITKLILVKDGKSNILYTTIHLSSDIDRVTKKEVSNPNFPQTKKENENMDKSMDENMDENMNVDDVKVDKEKDENTDEEDESTDGGMDEEDKIDKKVIEYLGEKENENEMNEIYDSYIEFGGLRRSSRQKNHDRRYDSTINGEEKNTTETFINHFEPILEVD